MDVSLLLEKSTFPVLTMRMSPHLEPFFFFLIYDCILHKCCAISNQYYFTNPISTFLPKFQGGGGWFRTPAPLPPDPPMVCNMFVYDPWATSRMYTCSGKRKHFHNCISMIDLSKEFLRSRCRSRSTCISEKPQGR